MTGPVPAEASGSVRRLRPEVVAKISAGEMILRPLSVAKELLENSLDAGAERIEIEIREAADRFLSCGDDGCGMSEGECRLAVERHATSKLREEEDLLAVRTLGFRGEALPSIARVARLRIVTSSDGRGGTELLIRGGHLESVRPSPRARGTTVVVEDLFFNSPVRKRFLRSPAGEVRLVQRLIAAYALARPGVDFRLVVDGRESLHYPPGDARARLEQVQGARFGEKVLPLEGDHPRIRVSGWIGIPEIARATASHQTFLVNGRWVAHPALSHALRQGYGDLIAPGRQPFAVILLDLAEGGADVNVHPTKREIRFLDESAVFAELVRVVRIAVARLVPGLAADARRWSASGMVRDEGGPARPDLTPGLGLRTEPHPERVTASDAEPAPMVELWQLQQRYIVAQTAQGILVVDQHAAHERVLYERAARALEGEQAIGQQLLFPVVVELQPGEADLLESLSEDLGRLGVQVDPFGGDSVILRSVPATWEGDPGAMLRDLLDDIKERTRRSEERRGALAASFACRSAIKSGRKLDLIEMNRLIDELFATGMPHGDPHGRPTYVVLSVDDLDQRFGRSG